MAVSGIGSTPGIGKINPANSNDKVKALVKDGLAQLKRDLPELYQKALESC